MLAHVVIEAGFHGFNAVAELKPQVMKSIEDALAARFHGFNAVAELKR